MRHASNLVLSNILSDYKLGFKIVLLCLCLLALNHTQAREIPQALIQCESLLLKGESKAAQSCLEANRSTALSPQNPFDIYWLELWLQFQLQNRDLNGKQNDNELKSSFKLANSWLQLDHLENASKQRLSYLIYLYYVGFESSNTSSALNTKPKKASSLGSHFFLAFMILLSFVVICLIMALFWHYFNRKGIFNSTQNEQIALQHHVKERDQEIIQQYSRLQDYSIANSHLVRAPLARLIGLVELLKDEPLTKDGKFYLQNIIQSCEELDDWTVKMDDILDSESRNIEAENELAELSHFLSMEK